MLTPAITHRCVFHKDASKSTVIVTQLKRLVLQINAFARTAATNGNVQKSIKRKRKNHSKINTQRKYDPQENKHFPGPIQKEGNTRPKRRLYVVK
jgi:hypothetical protein